MERTRKRYYLHLRDGAYRAEIFDPDTGNKVATRSTGTPNRDEAVEITLGWLKNGIPDPAKGASRTIKEVSAIKRVLTDIQAPSFTKDDAIKVVEALKARGFCAPRITGSFTSRARRSRKSPSRS